MERSKARRYRAELCRIRSNLLNARQLDDNRKLSAAAGKVFNQSVAPTLLFRGYDYFFKLHFCRVYLANVLDAFRDGVAIHASKNTSKLRNGSVRMQAVGALIRYGWLEEKIGFYNRQMGFGCESRYIPTPKLLETFEDVDEVAEFIRQDLISFKDSKKQVIPIPDHLSDAEWQYLARCEWAIAEINTLNSRHTFRYRIFDIQRNCMTSHVDAPSLRLTAKFSNSSTEDGGRLYCRAQSLRKCERATLTCDGKKTVELDYAGLHPAILYSIADEELKGDPYDIYGKGSSDPLRPFFKKVFNTLINARNGPAGIKACRFLLVGSVKGKMKSWDEIQDARKWKIEIRRRRLTVEKIIKDIKHKHHAIADYFASGFGVKLQNLDVMLAYKVCKRFCKLKIPIVPIHDSFVVPLTAKRELKRTMRRAYIKVFGGQPPQIK